MKTALLMLTFVAAASPVLAKPYHAYPNSGQAARCPYRKSNPHVLMVQSSQERLGDDAANGLDGPAKPVHPCSATGGCEPRCNISDTIRAGDEDAARQIQQHDPGNPA
jgi:hypothetical protein